jgi:hypothetical protein
MTAAQIRPAHQLSPLVDGIRTAIDRREDWADTAQLVADQMRLHLPTPDVLTTVSGFAPPGDIHRVRNTADEPAISIHVYGTDVTRVGSSARRYYD